MAYNPGVSDISGQIRAQGMTRGINSLLEGFDVGVKTYQQNKQIADTSIADFGAAVANSESLKALLADEEKRATLPSDVVKAYLKLNKEGSLGAREASLLGGFARSYTKNEEDMQQRALRDAQMAQIAQQGTIAKQASDLATQQGVRQQAEFSAMEDMNKKFRDLAALGAGDSPNEAAKAFLNSSAGKYVAAGGVLTPQLTAQFNIADQTSNARISAAEAEANQRAEEYRARAAAAETKLGEDPTPLIGSIRRALKEGTITQAQANQYMSDIFIKGGTVPESLSSQVEAAVSRGMGGKGTPTPTSAPMPTATPTTPTSAPAKYPTYRPDQLRSIPLDSEFTTTDGRLMYKDKGGIIRPGGRPTK
jgi:hypothetical protein